MALYGRCYLKLSESSKAEVLKQFPPKFSVVYASHITLEHGLLSNTVYRYSDVSIVGYQSTAYLEVLVVALDGNCTRQSDKKLLHITLSTLPNVPPVCSIDVLSEMLYQPVKLDLQLDVTFQSTLFNS